MSKREDIEDLQYRVKDLEEQLTKRYNKLHFSTRLKPTLAGMVYAIAEHLGLDFEVVEKPTKVVAKKQGGK